MTFFRLLADMKVVKWLESLGRVEMTGARILDLARRTQE